MMNSRLKQTIIFFISLYSLSCFSKVYTISGDDKSFEVQLSKILSDIDRLPDSEKVKVKIKGGYYPLSRTIQVKIRKHHISIEGSKHEPVVISGSIAVNEWDVLPGGIWRGRLPDEVGKDYVLDQLFVNGVRAMRSRTPNSGAFLLENGIKENDQFKAIICKEDAKTIGLFGNDEIPILTIFRKWAVSKRYLKSISHQNNALSFEGVEFPHNNKFVKGNWVVVENARSCIDLPGEWSCDKQGYIYYLPKKGEKIDETEFRIPILSKLVCISGGEERTGGLDFKNIIFEHTTYKIPVQGSELDQAASDMSASIEADDVENVCLVNCEIRNVANYGIWLRRGCSESAIAKCYFHDIGAGAIKIGSKKLTDSLTNHIIIDNNIISKYGVLMESAVGIILFHAADCKVLHNDIHDGYYSGISVGWVWGYRDSPSKRNEIAYNRISHIGTGLLNDLGGIYTLGKSEGTHIHHNVISDVISGDFRGWGMYADEGTSGVLFDKNLVFRCTSGGFHQHYGSENIVRNNIFAWGEKSQFTLSGAQEELPLTFTQNIILMDTGLLMSGGGVKSNHFKVGKNCYWKVSEGYPKVVDLNLDTWLEKIDTTSIYMNPLFRNPIKGDFRIMGSAVSRNIGFERFDFSHAGVYGSRKWKKLVLGSLSK